jgi:glycosyltransferase involved in cell wall biosynthesis
VLVVDSFSSDATPEMARAFAGTRFVQRVWEGPAAQFAHALSLIETEWVFSLDQDEICSSTLRTAIQDMLAGEKTPPRDVWYVARRSWYYDRFMKHSGWHPDYLPRVFRNGRIQVRVHGAHYSFHPLGAAARMRGEIIHYPYSGFRHHLDKINDYAQKGAQDIAAAGRKGGIARALGHALARFVRIYLFKRGFLDGKAGFVNAAHGAWYAFLKYVRVDEGSWGKPFDHDC